MLMATFKKKKKTYCLITELSLLRNGLRFFLKSKSKCYLYLIMVPIHGYMFCSTFSSLVLQDSIELYG